MTVELRANGRVLDAGPETRNSDLKILSKAANLPIRILDESAPDWQNGR